MKFHHPPILVAIFALLLLTSCGPLQSLLPNVVMTASQVPSPAPSHTPTSSPSATATSVPTQAATNTATATPTPTASPTATITPTSVDPWGAFPGPSEDSATEIPRPMPQIDFPEGTVNVMLLGSDKRPNIGGYRTDTLLLASLDPAHGSVTLFSIPRDLYVYLPGWRMDRINTAEPRGGFEMLADSMLYNFGIRIDHWVRVRFDGFEGAVNLLGGIDVVSTGSLNDECGGTYYHYAPGETYHMDGFTALCYVRMRKRSSDFDRLRRQQEAFLGMFHKVISIDGLQRVPELFDLFNHTFESDMTLQDVMELAPLASQIALEPERIAVYRIEPSMAPGWRVPTSGAAVLLPQREAIQALLKDAFP